MPEAATEQSSKGQGKHIQRQRNCSFMGQEEKGSVIFTEHNLNTIREKKGVVSNQRGEKKSQ